MLYSTLAGYKNKSGSGGPDPAVLKYHPLVPAAPWQNQRLSDDPFSSHRGKPGGGGGVGWEATVVTRWPPFLLPWAHVGLSMEIHSGLSLCPPYPLGGGQRF